MHPSRSGGRAEPRSRSIRGGFVLEALGIWFLLYPVFGWLRGLGPDPSAAAFDNAQRLIDLERFFGLYQEIRVQRWFLGSPWAVGFWNVWYGTVHFAMPVIAFVVLYRRDPQRYVRWRNTFLAMLAPILIGYWLYPLMPPRLLPASFGFVETRLAYFTIGGSAGRAEDVRFLYSAMPSMHIAFATWAALALWPVVRSRRMRGLLAAYPPLMLLAIVVTANHYFLDAAGSMVVLAIGYALACWWPRSAPPRRERRAPEHRGHEPATVGSGGAQA